MDFPDWMIIDDPQSPYYKDHGDEHFAAMPTHKLDEAIANLTSQLEDPEAPRRYTQAARLRLQTALTEREQR